MENEPIVMSRILDDPDYLRCDSLIEVLDATADYRPIRYEFESFESLEFLVQNTINWGDTTESFPIRYLRDAVPPKVPAALASLSRPKPIPQRKQLLMKATESICKAITPVMPAYYDLYRIGGTVGLALLTQARYSLLSVGSLMVRLPYTTSRWSLSVARRGKSVSSERILNGRTNENHCHMWHES